MPKRELIKMVPTIDIDAINAEINDYLIEVCDNSIASVDIDNDTWHDHEDINFNICVTLEIENHTVSCSYDEMIRYKPEIKDITETMDYVKERVVKEIIAGLAEYIKER